LKRKSPFGISLSKKGSHNKIAPGDIIQVSNNFYVVHEVGSRKIQVND
jgi:sorbitol-specific phosphotransferase system component IIA